VVLWQRHSVDNEGHVDVQFLIDRPGAESICLWDCVSGFGATAEARARFAAGLWAQTGGAACLELALSLRGDFADHYRGSEPGGFTNWHVIMGAIIGFGASDSASALQNWWLTHPVLPALARVLSCDLNEQRGPHGLKILFGGNRVAEVRLDGERHDGASRALASLAWPTLEPAAFVRSFVVLLHPEQSSAS
jgi:hypothetical protein